MRRFYFNGLGNANHIYGEDIFHIPDWKVIGEYVYDEEGGRHQAFISPIKEVTVLGSIVKPHERIQIEQSLKYTPVGADNLWKNAGLREVATWTINDEYGPSSPSLFIFLGNALRLYRPSFFAESTLTIQQSSFALCRCPDARAVRLAGSLDCMGYCD